MSRARSWAIRCSLELSFHDVASWCTLTYSDEYVPVTLSRLHLSAFFKRLRSRLEPSRIRFFGAGEYGEKTFRPHYHAILYGTKDAKAVAESWAFGHSQVDKVTPAAISYVAGYCAKKVGLSEALEDRIDYSTGEVYRYQPPFLQMSRGGRPVNGVRQYGIGGGAKVHWRSWRDSAIFGGNKVPVPRFLHDSFKLNASAEELQALALEKEERYLPLDVERLRASEKIALAKLSISSDRRSL